MRKFLLSGLILTSVFFVGCASTSQNKLLQSEDSQVKLRSIQSRVFDTNDKEKALRTAISTLQDLDFIIDKADSILGTVTGTKFVGQAAVKMTVSVRIKGDTQLIVRANAQYGIKAIEDPETYQDFFVSYEKAMFLTAQKID